MIDFEHYRQKGNDVLAVGIYWIGHLLTPTRNPELLEEVMEQPVDKIDNLKGIDGSPFVPHYELTYYGQPICINEYATEIAA